MTTRRERIEAEAGERAIAQESPDIGWEYGYEAGFIDGRTVTAGQMEAVNDAVIDAMIKYGPDGHTDGHEEISTAAAKAAGLLIEGDEHGNV